MTDLPPAPERRQRGEDALDLDVRERGGRLVQDQHARVAREHTCDLNELPLTHRESPRRSIERDVPATEQFEGLARAAAELFALVQQRHLHRAEPDIVLDREVRAKA
jgi:hypothetical protein